MLQRRKCALACFILLWCIFMPMGLAAPRLKIEPPAKQIALGQNAILTVQLQWPLSEEPYEINPSEPKTENLKLEKQNQSQSISISENPKLGQSWLPSWEKKSKPGQSQETSATVRHTLTYEFVPLQKGAAVIYSFGVGYRKSEADPWISIVVPEQNIRVVLNSPLKAILTWLVLVGGLALGVLASLNLWKDHKIRDATKDILPSDPKQRVYAKAEESIATFTSPNPKEKLTYWAHQLRTVIVTYYNVPSKTTPSAEILSFLKAKGLPTGEWNEISRLFGQLTEMQFSRQDIPAQDLDRMQKTLLQYVKGKIIIENSAS